MESVESSYSSSSEISIVESDASLQENQSESSCLSFTYEGSLWHDTESLFESDDRDIEVEITNLELLMEHHMLTDVYSETTDKAIKCGDESDSGWLSAGGEIDSLLLTRRRLPHLIHKKSSTPAMIIPATQEREEMIFETDYDVPLDEPLSKTFKRKSSADSPSTDSTTSFSDDDIWDSLTVDSLILTRRRLGATAKKERMIDRPLQGKVDSVSPQLDKENNEFIVPMNDTMERAKHHHHKHQFHHRNKRHHVHYGTKLHEIISHRPNNGGFNCAA